MLETANYRLTNVELYGMDAGELREHLAAYFAQHKTLAAVLSDPYVDVVAGWIAYHINEDSYDRYTAPVRSEEIAKSVWEEVSEQL